MVGSRIRNLRKQCKLTQEELALKLGVSRQAICMWEADKRELKARMLNKIARIFDITVDEIVKSQSFTNLKEEEPIMKKNTVKAASAKKAASAAEKAKLERVRFEVAAPAAKKVSIAGTFNQWDANVHAMKKATNGTWSVDLNLKPGLYEYKYVVDGQWWTDPRNNRTITNAHGTLNSVKEISA